MNAGCSISRISLVAFFSIIAFFVFAAPHCHQRCHINGECYDAFFCAKATGDCDGAGICVPMPEECTMQYDPVCGCDGETHGNRCLAANVGVNVDYEGECEPVVDCMTNEDCREEALYCAKEPEDCLALGYCMLKPTACYEIYAPVCGCDEVTYPNDCYAAAAGTNVLGYGTCEEVLCQPAFQCGPPLGMPNYLCEDGSIGGPTGYCMRNPDGTCGWRVRACPEG